MIARPATWTWSVADFFIVAMGYFGADYASRYGNDTVTDDHHQGCQGLTEVVFRRDVSIANSGHCNYRPVYAAGDAGESICFAFDNVD